HIVDMKIKLESVLKANVYLKSKNVSNENTKYNIAKLEIPSIQEAYSKKLEEKIISSKLILSEPDTCWKNLTVLCNETSKEILGKKIRKNKSENPRIKELSVKKKEIRKRI